MLLFFGNDELCSRRAAPATPKWSFLTIKKRLRQAASRGKWCFSYRNAILGKKKAPAASLQPEENGFGPPQQGSHWFTPTKEPVVHLNKGTIGSPKGTIGSPKGTIGSPKGTIGSPKGTIGSPKGTIGSPKGTIGSPKGTIGSVSYTHLTLPTTLPV